MTVNLFYLINKLQKEIFSFTLWMARHFFLDFYFDIECNNQSKNRSKNWKKNDEKLEK